MSSGEKKRQARLNAGQDERSKKQHDRRPRRTNNSRGSSVQLVERPRLLRGYWGTRARSQSQMLDAAKAFDRFPPPWLRARGPTEPSGRRGTAVEIHSAGESLGTKTKDPARKMQPARA